jgi:uncharacterized protein YoxC
MQIEFFIISVLLTVVGFLVVYVLNSIRGEISAVKDSLKNLESDLREGLSSLDRRVTIVETRCKADRCSV